MKTRVFTLAFLVSLSAYADSETRKAVEEVQSQMQSSSFQENAAKESKEAAAVRKHVKELSGNSSNEQDLYKLAAEVLGNMKDNSPEEMQRILQEAQKNPAAFAESWTPEQKKRLKEISERIPAAQGQKAKP